MVQGVIMALHFDLMVNNKEIGTFVAERQEHLDDIGDDGMATYHVWVEDQDGNVRRVVVRHRYNDGAWSLVQTALTAVNGHSGE
jgi:hypothetical protein